MIGAQGAACISLASKEEEIVYWMPAFAGMTKTDVSRLRSPGEV
ncbi:MAG TPA: cyclin family protein [Gammaproteobacteria bacterium]|nr:cyclin family protein [Gammaproteobacteria bacterium]